MRKVFVSFFAAILLAGCGNGNSKTTTPDTSASSTVAPKPAATLTPEQEKGETLIAQSDCLGCHKLEDKLQGPAYREVAQKYAGQAGIEDSLAQHIIKGHIGTWGQVLMTAHPALSQADAKAMVAYILSLKQ